MKQIQKPFIMSAKRIFHILVHLALIVQLNSCFLKQDRTTTVYGTITDQNGEAVDSILMIMQGSKHINYENLGKAYTDSTGHYELVADVPRKALSVNVLIPFSSNKKFQNGFKDYIVSKNEIKTMNCCNLDIGKKTRYDFQLIPK